MKAKVLFSEKQRFKQWWLWLILIVVTVLPFFGLYHELQKAEPFTDKATNTGFILSLLVILPVPPFLILIALKPKLTKRALLQNSTRFISNSGSFTGLK